MTAVQDEYAQFGVLVKDVYRGDWDSIRSFIDGYPAGVENERITIYGETALHIAARTANEEIVGKLAELMSPEALVIQDVIGQTALYIAAALGITKAVKYMVEKNTTLVEIANYNGFLPVTAACHDGHREMSVYLFTKTPFQLLSDQYENGIHGSLLLQKAIQSRMFDIALEILRLCPRLATVRDATVLHRTPFSRLPWTTDLFLSGSQLRFWQRWIYSCIYVRPLVADDDIGIGSYIVDQSVYSTSSTILQRVLGQFQGLCVNLLKFLGIKQIYDLKMTHAYSSILIQCICKHLLTLDNRTIVEIGIPEVLMKAVENGVLELVKEIHKVLPSFKYRSVDHHGRMPIMVSIANRQVNVFNLFLCSTGARMSFIDNFGNTKLHLAGMLLPSASSKLNQISGAALQMQRELQWYKEVEHISHPRHKLSQNRDILTPPQLFTKHHKHLVIEGEKWMKDTATSCSLVGALIITIMFTAAFTVPGGNIQDKGIPVFLHKKAFKIFVISDAVSLFSSSTSVMMFLGILTSRYAEQDFLISLPRKLIIGLSTLFISIAAMMVAFCAALIVMLDGMVELIVPIVSLACVPVIIFVFLQFPLLVEIFMSTYGPSIFKRRKEAYVLNV